MHVGQLGQLYQELQAQHTEVLVIGGGSVNDAVRLAKAMKTPFPVLADADRAAYSRYSLGKSLWVIQHSGTMLVDQGGLLRYAHAGPNPNDALDRTGLRAAVAGVQGQALN